MKQILVFVFSVGILLLSACAAQSNAPETSTASDRAGITESTLPRQEEPIYSSAGNEIAETIPTESTMQPTQPTEPQPGVTAEPPLTTTPPTQKPTQPPQAPQETAETKPPEIITQPSEAPTEPPDTASDPVYTQADFDRIISEVRAYAESYAAQGFRFIWTDSMAFSQDVGYFGTPYLRQEGVDGTISRLQYHVDKIVKTSTDPANGVTVSEMSYKVVQIERNGEIAFAVIYGG